MDDDRLDETLASAAREYRRPPATPREEIWAGIEAGRRRQAATPVIALADRRRSTWIRAGLALAAVLLLGIAIGRWQPAVVTGPTPADAALAANERGTTMVRYAAIEHLSRINALLTDYQTGTGAEELRGNARDLLSRTRLLLDARYLEDPAIRALLEDLEMLLIQVAQLPSNGVGTERALIDDNLAERAIRPRLRNAIPAGPAA